MSFEVFYDTRNKFDATLRVGEIGLLYLHVDNTVKYYFETRITSVEHTCNVEGGDIQVLAVEGTLSGQNVLDVLMWTYTTGVNSPAVSC